MKISQRKEGDVLILELSGRMAIGHGEADSSATILAALGSGVTKVLLEMHDVPMIDSSGIGELVASYTAAKKAGAALKLLNLSSQVEEVITSTQLIRVFEVFDDETAALASFG